MVKENDLPWFGSAHHRSKQRGFGRVGGFRCQAVSVMQSSLTSKQCPFQQQTADAQEPHPAEFGRRRLRCLRSAAVEQQHRDNTDYEHEVRLHSAAPDPGHVMPRNVQAQCHENEHITHGPCGPRDLTARVHPLRRPAVPSARKFLRLSFLAPFSGSILFLS